MQIKNINNLTLTNYLSIGYIHLFFALKYLKAILQLLGFENIFRVEMYDGLGSENVDKI